MHQILTTFLTNIVELCKFMFQMYRRYAILYVAKLRLSAVLHTSALLRHCDGVIAAFLRHSRVMFPTAVRCKLRTALLRGTPHARDKKS